MDCIFYTSRYHYIRDIHLNNQYKYHHLQMFLICKNKYHLLDHRAISIMCILNYQRNLDNESYKENKLLHLKNIFMDISILYQLWQTMNHTLNIAFHHKSDNQLGIKYIDFIYSNTFRYNRSTLIMSSNKSYKLCCKDYNSHFDCKNFLLDTLQDQLQLFCHEDKRHVCLLQQVQLTQEVMHKIMMLLVSLNLMRQTKKWVFWIHQQLQ